VTPPQSPTNHVTPSSRATIRDGASAGSNIDEQALGYLMVKYNTNGFSAKAYLQFDLTARRPNPNLPASLTLIRHSVSGPQRLQLWALNQPYPSMSADITWLTAQANETNSNRMLTNGLSTATCLTELAVAETGAGSNTLTIAAPWGQFICDSKLVLVLTGGEYPTSDNTGYRIAITNSALLPTFDFSSLEGVPPAVATLPPASVTVSAAQLNALVNAGNLVTACYFQYGPTTNYGSFSATNSLAAGTNTIAVGSAIAGLVAAALYHYRVVGSNAAGLSLGQDLTFTTMSVGAPVLAGPAVLVNGAFQFEFDNPYDVDFTVLTSTNLDAPTGVWTALGSPVPVGDGMYQFTDSAAANCAQRFYLLRSQPVPSGSSGQ
jgi:hypothetical protein